MTDYKVMPLNQVLKYEDEMKKQGVSEVARSSRGFLGNLKKYKSFANMKNKTPPNENISWEDKRRAFIKRHMAQYRKNPTERRRLALIAWAFMPN